MTPFEPISSVSFIREFPKPVHSTKTLTGSRSFLVKHQKPGPERTRRKHRVDFTMIWGCTVTLSPNMAPDRGSLQEEADLPGTLPQGPC